jgi:TonB family protein
MKNILLTILIISVSICFGQDLKSITNKQKESPFYTEKYQVLKSDKQVKHGSYKALGWKGCLVIKGQYQDDKKEGTWTEYVYRSTNVKSICNYVNDTLHGEWFEYSMRSGNCKLFRKGGFIKGEKHGSWTEFYAGTEILAWKGKYVEDKKNGVWEFYHYANVQQTWAKGKFENGNKIGLWNYYSPSGKLEQEYNHSAGELISFDQSEPSLEVVLTEKDSAIIIVEQPCLYIGGDFARLQHLMDSTNYPETAVELGISGTVIVSFIVDVNGKMKNVTIKEGVDTLLNKEAIRVIKTLHGYWIPALLNSKPVATLQLTPISFRLR